MPTRKINCDEAKSGLEELLKLLVRVQTDGDGEDVLDADGKPQYVILTSPPDEGS